MAGARKHKKLVWLAGLILVGLIVLGLATLPFLFDIERHRERVERALEDATGWEAELGKLELSFSGGLAIGVRPAHLAAPGEASRFDVDEIAVRVAVWPLLHRELRIESIGLVRPQILLVRRDADEGWILPRTAATGGGAASASAPSAASPAVRIERIDVKDGALRFEDRTVKPPRVLALEAVDIAVLPATGGVSGSARVGTGGRIVWSTPAAGALDVRLDELATDVLVPWIGPDVLHAGGRIGGQIAVRWPNEIVADLKGEELRALAGSKPLPTCELHVRLRPQDGGLAAEELRLSAGGATVTGGGSLAPLDLRLALDEAPLEAVLALTEALFPLGLDVTPPGSAAVRARILGSGYEAEGEIAAARFAPASILPPVTDLRASFKLSRSGQLELSIEQGTVGGGPLAGQVRLDRIEPLGTLVFEGSVRDASLGSLLRGLAGESAERVTGATTVEGRVSIDLSAPVVDASSVRGQLDLRAAEVRIADFDLEGRLQQSIRDKLGALGALVGKSESSSGGPKRLLDAMAGRVSFDTLPWPLPLLRLTSGHVEAQGAGSFDPVGGRVELTLAATLDEAMTAEYLARQPSLRALVDASGRLRLPLRLRGPLAAPAVEVDLSSASSKEAAKGLLEGLLERQLEKKKNNKKTPKEPADPP